MTVLPDRRRATLAATALALCAAAVTEPLRGAGPDAPAAEGAPDAILRLAGRAMGPTPMLDDLRELCDRVGGRPTGSPACERAVEWAAGKLRAAGADRVALESFTVPRLWLGGSAEAACVAPEPFPLRITAAPYSPSTPGGGPIEAPLVDAGAGRPEDLDALGEAARGAVALVRTGEMRTLGDLFDEYLRNAPLIESAAKAGVSAILWTSTRPRGLLYRHPVSVTATMAPMPVAVVSREHALRLARLLEARESVRIRLAVSNRTEGPFESSNVIGEIQGRERPGEIVLLGAHLDSWDLGTGAEDDGVNVALVIDVARGIKALGLVPRRTIRFALFTGEEQGMWGSAGYVKRHAAEMSDHVAAVIFDIGSGRTKGFYLNGREELRAPVDRALAPLSALGPFSHLIDGVDGTDNFDFLLSGVPNLVADQEAGPYLPDYHAESDVLERVDVREARANAAIAAALVWSLAESPDRPARRQSRAEVERLLAETKLDEQMKAFRQWEDWTDGRRGVHP